MIFFRILILILGISTSVWGLSNFKVTCENERDCNPSVAGLATPTGVCTAFLVGPQLVGTNLHCLPESMWKNGTSCQGSFEIILPKTVSFPEERIGCNEVVLVSPPLDEVVLRPDYAFLSLTKASTRPTLNVNRKGVADKQMLTITRMNPQSGSGVIQNIQCKAVQNSLLNPIFKNKFSPLVFLSQCPIVKGNSGSPMLDEQGEVVGIVSSSLFAEQAKQSNQSGNGTNLACIEGQIFSSLGAVPTDCDQEYGSKAFAQKQDQLQIDATENLKGKIGQAVINELKRFHKSNLIELAFNVNDRVPSDSEKKLGIHVVFDMEPVCYRPKQITNFLNKAATFNVSLSRWSVTAGTDEDFKIQTDLKEKKIPTEFQYTATAEDLKKGRLNVKMIVDHQKKTYDLVSCDRVRMPALEGP